MPPVPSKPKPKLKSSGRDLREFECDGSNVQETEQKRSKGQMACAECKRLKIKCDKQIPCQSCRRRGCAALCPNGILSTGQGTRFVLAATEHLHRQLAKMSERIRQLEDALSELQAKHSTEPHPLLQPDLLRTCQRDDDVGHPSVENLTIVEDTPELVEALGTLSISDSGVSRFFGPTGGSHIENVPSEDSDDGSSDSARELPQEIEIFSRSLPFKPAHSTLNVENLVNDYLPTWERARYLIDVYLDQAISLYQNVSKDDILSELLPAYYTNGVPHVTQAKNNPHRLSLLFLIFAFGALLNPNQEPGVTEAERYHQLARAAICLQSVMDKPSLETIQTLHLLSIYNSLSGNELAGKETSMETSCSLVALAAQLAHTVLSFQDRDGLRWGLSHAIVVRRRMVFWDLFVADVWNSLHVGRPPTLSLPYIDCQFPGGGSPHDEVLTESGRRAFFGTWMFRFTSDCVADVTARTLASNPPSYSTILELDRKVRNFPVTAAAEEFAAAACGAVPAKPAEKDIGLMESMHRLIMTNAREAVLLYIHRSYFVQAITTNPINPLNSLYTPSFLAAYRASLTILRTVKVQYDLHPKLTARLWLVWTYAFSAAVVFGAIVTRGPRSPMASSAMKELHDAHLLFTMASSHSRRAQKALPIVTKLTEKAHNALLRAQSDMPYELGQQWGVAESEGDDAVDIFAGRMKIVSMNRQMTGRMSEGSSKSDGLARQPSTSALMLQQKQSQVEPVVPQPYSCEQLGSTWPHEFGSVAQATQKMPTLDWTLHHPDTASQPTFIQPPPTSMQIPPHVQYSGEQLDSTLLQQPGSAAALEQTQEMPTFDWTLHPNASSHSTFIQPPPTPLQISADVPSQASAHGGPVAGPSTGPWQPELSDSYSMTNLSAPSAQAYSQEYHPDHQRYDQYGQCPSSLSALPTVSYYDDLLSSSGAHHHQSQPQPPPCTHPHTDTQPHHPIQPLPCDHQPDRLHPPQFQAESLVPPELAQLGLVAAESGLDQRWILFMRESGLFDGCG
ncbi:hypothetical protein EDC04DRAFT_2586961 [Pisolithus marmoratus]|nr:hypothetical protein EDC04DRAFT_2586961 [Pisolithus marmoratus]